MTRNTLPGESGFALSAPHATGVPTSSTPGGPSGSQSRTDALIPDPDGYRAAHQYLERQLARLTDDNAALRGLLEQAILRLASATGHPEQVIRCELGAPPQPTWNRGGTP